MVIYLKTASFEKNIGFLSVWPVHIKAGEGLQYQDVKTVEKDQSFVFTAELDNSYNYDLDNIIVKMGETFFEPVIENQNFSITIEKVTNIIILEIPTKKKEEV